MKHSHSMLALLTAIVLIMIPTFVFSEQAAPAETPAANLPAAETCKVCGKEHVILPCGDHAICDAEVTAEDYAGHELAECGDHHVCEEKYLKDPELHTTRGKACQEYMCHKINASYHSRCKHCGGPLCYNNHGRGICYDFGYNFMMDLLNGAGYDDDPAPKKPAADPSDTPPTGAPEVPSSTEPVS